MERRKFLGLLACLTAETLAGAAIARTLLQTEKANAQSGEIEYPYVEDPSNPEFANFPQVKITGTPDVVARENQLIANEVSNGTFTNQIGSGEMILAEPGTLLVGPEPTITQAEVDASNGAIQWRDNTNSYVLANNGGEDIQVTEGRFVWINWGHGNFKFRDFEINMPQELGHQWWFIMRNPFTDGELDTDQGQSARATDYAARQNLVQQYPAGAFVSEGAVVDALKIVKTENNCGLEGCSKLSVVYFDSNTGAYEVVQYLLVEGKWRIADTNLEAAA